MSEALAKDLKALGEGATRYNYDKPDNTLLEWFPSPLQQNDSFLGEVDITCPEFTSLCVSGDTYIDVASNEIAAPKGVKIKDLVGTEGYLFSFDPSTSKPVAKRYHSVRKTRVMADVVRVNMTHFKGTGKGGFIEEPSSITVTPDHLMLVRTGWNKFEWVEAKDLKKGCRLVADQRSVDSIRGLSRHRLLAEAITKLTLSSEDLVHHLDHNHYNNNVDNLQVTNMSEHSSHHQSDRYGYTDLLDVDTLVSLYEQGENFNSLAEMYKCDVSTIESRIKHLNHRVDSVEEAPPEDVYNLEVEDTECYFANGVVVHNCPKTGQPDFATIIIKYVPNGKCVESKSLKLYLGSFRNHGEFHESCISRIADDLVKLLDPLALYVKGEFTPRGGIPFWPSVTYTKQD